MKEVWDSIKGFQMFDIQKEIWDVRFEVRLNPSFTTIVFVELKSWQSRIFPFGIPWTPMQDKLLIETSFVYITWMIAFVGMGFVGVNIKV